MPRRPALVRRLPRVLGSPPSEPIVSPEARAAYPEFEADFRVLDEELVPAFARHDAAALRAQNRFRLQQLALIAGGASATILGGVHATLGSRWAWTAVVASIVAAVLAVVALIAQRTRMQQEYLESRLRAEKLRGEYFRFIARLGKYGRRVAPRSAAGAGRGTRAVSDPDRLVAFYNECRLDNQLDFYERRSDEFGAAANQLAVVSAVVLGLTAIVSALATHESGLTTTFAILAIALPVLSTALAGYGALYAFEQRQKLYRDAVRSLQEARGVGADEPAAYVEKIEAIFDNEQAQWGQIIAELKPAAGGG